MTSNPTLNTILRIARYLCATALALAASLFAQSFTTTTVQGTVYLANGKPASGTAQIIWPAFTTAAGQAVTAGRTSLKLGSDGFLTVSLAPNQGSSPAGLYYTVVYNLADGSTATEYWTVPAAAQAAIAQVRASVMPAAQAVQAVSKAYVDQAVQQVAKAQMSSTGGTLTGPLYLDADPLAPAQAANKHYVDAQFAQALPKNGGIASGPLTATQLGAVFQVDQMQGVDFGAQLQACVDRFAGTNGGTCDARNFPGVLTMANSVNVSTANMTIYLPCATITTSASFVVAPGTRNVTLHGCASRGTSATSGSQGGTVFAYSGSGLFFEIGDPAYVSDTLGFHLDNVVVNTTSSPSATATALAAYRTQEMHLESLYLLGNSNQTGITLDGTGNYTGGTFTDIELVGFQNAINAIGHQVANAAPTDWLNASTFVRPHVVCPVANGSPIAGTIGINLAQGDGNTFTGGDIEGCATALHLGANAQNNTIVGLRTENSTSQVVADAGSSYNNWISGGTMFTGKLTDNGTRNSFMDTFHRSFNGLNGDWFGTQQDATLTNHYRLGIGTGNERGLLNRYQTDYGYRWTTGVSDATGGAQFYQVLDELNSVYRLSIGQYNHGAASTNNQTIVNSAGTGAVVLNGSNNAGTGGVVFGSGGPTSTTVATVDKQGNANFTGTLQVAGTAQTAGTMTVRNNADAEVDYYLWPGLTTNQKGSFTYKDYAGNSQWYMVKDASNNWALNSALGGLDSIKAYQSNNSGDTYINASNSSGAVRINYEAGAGSAFHIYGGSSGNLYASFTGANAIKFPGLAAGSGKNCLQVDAGGWMSNTGTPCGSGSGTVNSGNAGQVAYYSSNGTALAGLNAVPMSKGGTGASDATTALANLGALPLAGGSLTGQLNGTDARFTGTVTAEQAVRAPVQDKGGQVYSVYAYGAVSDAKVSLHGSMTAGSAALSITESLFNCATDAGKTISVQGAGASGGQLTTTIAGCTDSNHVTLAVAASTNTLSGVIEPTAVGLSNAGSGYLPGAWQTTTSGGGSGAVLSIDAPAAGGPIKNLTYGAAIVQGGSGYAVGDKVYPTVSGSSGTAYATVTAVDGAGVVWGTDNYTAFANWMAACGGSANCLIPKGSFLIDLAAGTRTLTVPANTTISMDRQGALYWTGSQNGYHAATGRVLFTLAANGSNVSFIGLHCEGENQVSSGMFTMNGTACIGLPVGGNTIQHLQVKNSILQHSFGNGITAFSHATDLQITGNVCAFNLNTCFNVNSSQADISHNYFLNDAGIEASGADSHYDFNIMVNPLNAPSAIAGGGDTSGTPYKGGTISGNIIVNPLSYTSAIQLADAFSHGTVANNRIIGQNNTNSFCLAAVYTGYTSMNDNTFEANKCVDSGAKGTFYASAVNSVKLRNNMEGGTNWFGGALIYGGTGHDSEGNYWTGGSADLYLSNAASGSFRDKLAHGTKQALSSSVISGDSRLINGTHTDFQGAIAVLGNDVIPATATGFHGSTGTKLQMSDGTGAATHYAVYDANGVLTDGGAPTTGELAVYPGGDWLCAKGGDTTIGQDNVTGLSVSGPSATINVSSDARTLGYVSGETISISPDVNPSSLAGSYTLTSVTAGTLTATANSSQTGSWSSGGHVYHVCKNASDAMSSGTAAAFSASLTIPATTSYPADYKITATYSTFAPGSAPAMQAPIPAYGATGLTAWNTNAAMSANAANWPQSQVFSLQFPQPGYAYYAQLSGLGANNVKASTFAQLGTGSNQTLTLFNVFWTPTGLASGTYTGGGTIAGSAGQTCTLSGFNNGLGSTPSVIVALTGTNTIAGGTPLTVSTTGYGATAAPTTATLGNGTASCSGTATISATLGGAQGTAIGLRSLTAKQQ